jgi:four helix bundle protein
MVMNKNNNAQTKSYDFAVQIVKLCREIQIEDKEYVISTQLLKSGTSVGANLEEALGSQSDKDLLTKLFIAYKEARESRFWLRLMYDAEMIEKSVRDQLIERCTELMKILGASIRTLRSRIEGS